VLITIAKFREPQEAHMLPHRLWAEGIFAVVSHQYHVGNNWVYSTALGGVKVQVLRAQQKKRWRLMPFAAPGISHWSFRRANRIFRSRMSALRLRGLLEAAADLSRSTGHIALVRANPFRMTVPMSGKAARGSRSAKRQPNGDVPDLGSRLAQRW
jgi:hypothetical protein